MEFDDLYQEIILDHYRNPRGAEKLDTVVATVHENPVCGDSIKVVLETSPEGRINRVRYDCSGCAISTASASIMTELLKGKDLHEAAHIAQEFVGAMRGERDPVALDALGDAVAMRSVSHFPLRVKCATLAWHAVQELMSE